MFAQLPGIFLHLNDNRAGYEKQSFSLFLEAILVIFSILLEWYEVKRLSFEVGKVKKTKQR